MKPLNIEMRDQFAHFFAAFAAVNLIDLMQGIDDMRWYVGAAIGLAMALPREHSQHGIKVTRGSALDIAFWTLGGLVVALLV